MHFAIQNRCVHLLFCSPFSLLLLLFESVCNAESGYDGGVCFEIMGTARDKVGMMLRSFMKSLSIIGH